jgi:hypothetical protein
MAARGGGCGDGGGGGWGGGVRGEAFIMPLLFTTCLARKNCQTQLSTGLSLVYALGFVNILPSVCYYSVLTPLDLLRDAWPSQNSAKVIRRQLGACQESYVPVRHGNRHGDLALLNTSPETE